MKKMKQYLANQIKSNSLSSSFLFLFKYPSKTLNLKWFFFLCRVSHICIHEEKRTLIYDINSFIPIFFFSVWIKRKHKTLVFHQDSRMRLEASATDWEWLWSPSYVTINIDGSSDALSTCFLAGHPLKLLHL